MSTQDPAAQVAGVLSRHLGPGARVGVAVSGGGDSTALMHMARDWAAGQGAHLHIATVDHGLRPEAAAEADHVAEAARALGLAHDTLRWSGWQGTGNLQDAARRARYDLLAEWAARHDLAAVLLGHTLEDVAETFLMRLGRGSGVDGLSAMAEARVDKGRVWLRPMLGVERAALREWLRARDVAWVEDPSNDDTRFERVRLRKALAQGAALDLTPERLARTAHAMARARVALDARARDCARDLARVEHGTLSFEQAGLAALEEETRLRLLAAGLQWSAANPYRPRLSALEGVWEQVETARGATLHGCALLPHRGRLVIAREYAGVADHEVAGGALWDGRWRLDLPDRRVVVAALGEKGAAALETRPQTLPRAAVLSLPGLWDNDALVSVPALSWGLAAQIGQAPDEDSFLRALIAH